ncbi:hypothetical protein VA7868_04286 [Vibrio aerogenes CECT 7868]|uniref:Uncharacterized protein n=1 Tax=Vibrio aerogenes CECT 7868 TaxID=1216006 RepID=A0A1M6DPL4_9VIBR|nr:hypothetical protein VA7868_04286 [Vibrio aerogenes CECT 7868]
MITKITLNMKARIAFLLAIILSPPVYSGSPPQDEKLLQSLIQRGIICKGLSYDEQQEALRIYLNRKARKDKSPSEAPDSNSFKTCIAPHKK